MGSEGNEEYLLKDVGVFFGVMEILDNGDDYITKWIY